MWIKKHLKWTKNKPTKPGWYWYRDLGEIEIVQIINISGKLHLWYERDDEAYDLEYQNGAEWAGPLPEPKTT